MTQLHALHAHTSACFCLELSPTGRYLAVGGSDALISLWDTAEWVCRRTLAGMVGAVKAVGFSWDGSFVVGGSDEGNGLEIVRSAFFLPYEPPIRLPGFFWFWLMRSFPGKYRRMWKRGSTYTLCRQQYLRRAWHGIRSSTGSHTREIRWD